MRALWILATLMACDSSTTPSDTESSSDTESASEAVCTEAAEVGCIDEMILDLSLHDDKTSDGEITNSDEGDYWLSTFDASAGGYGQAANNAWLYMAFTDNGLEAVEIDDESALESMEWHLSARRFILRLNGGSSGPSCVGAAAFLESDFEEVADPVDGLTFYTDDFYTDDCTIVNDSSGLPGSPQTALASWWSYPGCVATSSVPFHIQLDDGRVVRFVVDAYYGSGQDDCNSSGNQGDDSGYFTVRWSFVS